MKTEWVWLFVSSGLVFMACSSTQSSGGIVADAAAPDAIGSDVLAAATDTETASADTATTDTSVEKDTSVQKDTSVEKDTAATEDTGTPQDTGPELPIFDCDPVGTWTLNIKSDLKQGDGCGKDGKPGQKENQKVYVVERNADGTLVGTLPAMKEPTPVITVSQVAVDAGCAIKMTMAATIVFPPDNNGVVDTVTAAYKFNLIHHGGDITGGGQMHMTTITDKGVAKVDCKEPLAITGQFTAGGK